MERDAGEVARLQARRYAIQAARIDSALTEGDQRELAELGRQAEAIEEKYRRDRVWGNLLPELNNRRRELVVAEAGPAWNRLMLEKFPGAERVAADFPEGPRRAAAFAVLFEEFALARTLRPPRTPELTARDQAYQAGMDAAVAKARAGGEQSREWKAFEAEVRRLMMNPGFKREVLGRYVPLFASFVKAEAGGGAAAGGGTGAPLWLFKPLWVSEDERSYVLVAHAVWAGAGLMALLGGLAIPVWWLRRAGRRHDPAKMAGIQKAGAEAGELPEVLRVVELPRGMRVALTVTSGVVLEKEGWVETTTSTHTTPATNDQPARTTTQVHTTRKDRLWVRTVEGKEEAWTVTNDVFPARAGQAVSWVSAVLRGGKATCVAYNHATGGVFEKAWVAEANRVYWGAFFAAWLWAAGCMGVSAYMAVATGSFRVRSVLGGGLVVSAVVLLIYAGVVRAVIVGGRTRAWKARYRPGLMAWLESRGAEISRAGGKG